MKLKIANNVDITKLFSASIRAGKSYDWEVTLETHSNNTCPTIRSIGANFVVVVEIIDNTYTISCALRGRGNQPHLEFGTDIANCVTSFTKDSMVLVYGDFRSE